MIMTAEPAVAATPAKFSDYLELTKPRLSLLSVLTALVGYLAARPPSNPSKLFFVALGTSLAASTLIEVKGLARPGCCVEIEITAAQ